MSIDTKTEGKSSGSLRSESPLTQGARVLLEPGSTQHKVRFVQNALIDEYSPELSWVSQLTGALRERRFSQMNTKFAKNGLKPWKLFVKKGGKLHCQMTWWRKFRLRVGKFWAKLWCWQKMSIWIAIEFAILSSKHMPNTWWMRHLRKSKTIDLLNL